MTELLYGRYSRVYNWLLNDRGWQISNEHLKAAMGFSPTKHWPDKGCSSKIIGNVMVWIKPKKPKLLNESWSSRAQCFCPECGKQMNPGRLVQHAWRVHNYEFRSYRDGIRVKGE